MTHPDLQGALPRIAQALEDVTTQLSDISAELRAITAGPAAPAAPQPSAPTAAPFPPPYPGNYPPPGPFAPPMRPPGPYYPPPPPKPSVSQRLSADGAGSKLLVWIGGAITLVGVVLMLVLAIQRGWIGPVPRVLIGAVLAGALVAVALRAHRTPAGRAGAFALAATGIAALYLDVIAATAMLDLLPSWFGLALGLLIAGAGLYLAARWQAQPLAVFVLVGCALCAPFITEGFNALLLGFLLVMQLSTVPVQLTRGWMWVPLAAGIPPLLVALVSVPMMIRGDAMLAGLLMALLASLLTAGVAVVSGSRRPADGVPLVLLLCAPAPTLLLAAHVPIRSAAVTTILLALPLIAVWVVGRVRSDVVSKWIGVAAGGVSAVCLLYASALLLPGDARAIGLLGEAVLLSVAAFVLRSRGLLMSATGFASVGTLIALGTVAGPSRVLLPPVTAPDPLKLVLGALAFALIGGASLALVLTRAQLDKPAPPEGDRPGLAAAQLLSGVTTLYGASGLTLCLALLVLPDRAGFLLGHTVVTVSWMIAALVLLQRGITARGPRIAGLVLVGAALVKLVLFDLAALDGIARVAAFLGAGLVLLGAGVRYARLVATQEQAAEQVKQSQQDTNPRVGG